jgi:hypothetical protein
MVQKPSLAKQLGPLRLLDDFLPLRRSPSSTPGGLIGNDLSRLFFTCTNTSQAATYTSNT